MPKRPVKRVSFTVEQWPSRFRIRAALYDHDNVIAVTSREVAMLAPRAETADVSELMDLLQDVIARVQAYAQQDTLPW